MNWLNILLVLYFMGIISVILLFVYEQIRTKKIEKILYDKGYLIKVITQNAIK